MCVTYIDHSENHYRQNAFYLECYSTWLQWSWCPNTTTNMANYSCFHNNMHCWWKIFHFSNSFFYECIHCKSWICGNSMMNVPFCLEMTITVPLWESSSISWTKASATSLGLKRKGVEMLNGKHIFSPTEDNWLVQILKNKGCRLNIWQSTKLPCLEELTKEVGHSPSRIPPWHKNFLCVDICRWH